MNPSGSDGAAASAGWGQPWWADGWADGHGGRWWGAPRWGQTLWFWGFRMAAIVLASRVPVAPTVLCLCVPPSNLLQPLTSFAGKDPA